MLSYRELLEQAPSVAILPVGCYEQHGPVLPLDTDNLIAQAAAHRLAERLGNAHVFPLLAYTTTEPNVNFAGTVSVAADPFRAYLREVCRAILGAPFESLVVVNSHGSIVGSLKEIGFELVMEQYRRSRDRVRPVLVLNVFDCDRTIEAALGEEVGRHADWKEFLLCYGLLGESYFTPERRQRLQQFAKAHAFDDQMPRVLGIPAELRSTDGVQGRPLPRSTDYARQAEQVWDITVDYLHQTVVDELDAFTRLATSR
ncbi:MAG: creatininase family protein [Vulcanimicrobiota bacterium]